MSVSDLIETRGITEILHYTTNSGLTGMIAQQAIKCRNLLTKEKYLEHIYKQSCPDRSRDKDYHGYVNLSISKINARLFNIASGNWHNDIDGWWCIVSIKPEVLSHTGVIFTTTNNIYTGVRRSTGDAGLQAMFADRIVLWTSKEIRRTAYTPHNCPTCNQAEALYPNEVPFSYVDRIYFRSPDHADAAVGIFSACSVSRVPLTVDGSKFQ